MTGSASRDRILARVRAGLAHDPAQVDTRRRAALDYLGARAQNTRPRLAGDLTQRFCQRALAMSSTLDRVASLAQVPAAVARYLTANGLPVNGVCWACHAALDWAAAGLHIEARAAGHDDLLGITGTFCAIAATGTLMLLSGAQTAATTSLLPETHIAIVPASRIVAGMEEGFALLRAEYGELPHAVNFVSGPSRTGDIELTMVLGAHGPYRVHLLIVDDQ
jgi:L-lactate dehydrogenase complex protein LldG